MDCEGALEVTIALGVNVFSGCFSAACHVLGCGFLVILKWKQGS